MSNFSCGVQNIHPGNKKNFHVSIFITPLSMRRRWLVSFTCQLLYCKENRCHYLVSRRLGGSQNQLDAIHSFIHSIGMCRMRWFLVVLRGFFNSSLLYTLSFHPFPPTSLPSSLTSSCHLFFGLPVSLVAFKFIYNTFLRILFSSVLCTCPNQHNLFNLIVSVIVGFFNHCVSLFIG